ncbi:alpha/beta fold hydrolase [Kaistia sp. MMO-174]|uniref:alpha/beta fold hydrolase n=1 Tax=Kaistia sp. MMO-174 TaxID=3081256 RepID=UPI003015F4C1
MPFRDDELVQFAADGTSPLPVTDATWIVENEGARIWCASYGEGAPVILLHGGLGHSGNWNHQVPALVDAGYRAIVVDSRGHGRSTRDGQQPYSYDLMASDVLVVMDRLGVTKAAIIGWSDGACTGLVLARRHPERVAGVFFFACNMDSSGTKPFVGTPVIDRCFSRHVADYAALSATPDDFKAFSGAVGLMQQTQPEYGADDLAAIDTPVTVCQSAEDEFIRIEHAEYLAQTLPEGRLKILEGVTHFAPLQRPALFNEAIADFLATLPSR